MLVDPKSWIWGWQTGRRPCSIRSGARCPVRRALHKHERGVPVLGLPVGAELHSRPASSGQDLRGVWDRNWPRATISRVTRPGKTPNSRTNSSQLSPIEPGGGQLASIARGAPCLHSGAPQRTRDPMTQASRKRAHPNVGYSLKVDTGRLIHARKRGRPRGSTSVTPKARGTGLRETDLVVGEGSSWEGASSHWPIGRNCVRRNPEEPSSRRQPGKRAREGESRDTGKADLASAIQPGPTEEQTSAHLVR